MQYICLFFERNGWINDQENIADFKSRMFKNCFELLKKCGFLRI